MQQDVAGGDEWLPIRDAARACDVPLRTIYAQVDRGGIVARKVGRIMHVSRPAVQRLADERRGGNAKVSPDSAALATARERAAAMHLAAQEAQSAVAMARSQQALADADAERDRKRALVEVQIQREQVALLRDRMTLEREAREREAADRRAEEHDILEIQREDRRRAEDRAAAERRRLEDKWLVWARCWVAHNLGIEPKRAELTSIVRATVAHHAPHYSSDEIVNALEQVLPLELRIEIAENERARLERDRDRLVRFVAASVTGYSDDHDVLLGVLRATARDLDVHQLASQAVLIVLARKLHQRFSSDPHCLTRVRAIMADRTRA